MSRFALRGRSATPSAPRDDVCHKCGMSIAADARAIEAYSIVDDAEPSFFHLDCAPSADNLRWRARREVPIRVVRSSPD
jgi:hypothetical protein